MTDRACGGGGPQIRRGASVSTIECFYYILGNNSTIKVLQNRSVLASRNRPCTMQHNRSGGGQGAAEDGLHLQQLPR